jgi:hypothetical protein
MKLIKYRDMPDPTHTYFWVSDAGEDGVERILSPFFNSEDEAIKWISEQEPK